MGASEDFIAALKNTEAMQSLLQSLEDEPARLLSSICREYEATNQAVADHHLSLPGYFNDAMLRALLSAKLITMEPGDRFSICSYKPTETGLNFYKGMLAEKKF